MNNIIAKSLEEMKCIGGDDLCVPEISINNLAGLHEKGKKLKSIYVISQKDSYKNTIFIFSDNTFYIASGFSVGYKGKNPKNLIRIIRMWHPEKFTDENSDNKLFLLDSYKDWLWTPEKDFIEVEHNS
jgi:hypothetical protein